MLSRSLAILAAATLAFAPVAASAQARPDRTPTRNLPTTEEQGNSDLLLILAAIVAAALITFGATQLGGDKPASP
jgi:hypothetical protein